MKVCPACGRRYPPTATTCEDDGELLEYEPPQIGEIVDGRYRIDAVLGEGGMGLVLKATQSGLNRPVTIKFVRSEIANDPTAMKRFEREAHIASQLHHPSIVDVMDYAECPTFGPYYTMPYLPGETLADRIRSAGPMDIADVLLIGRQLASALGVAHNAGVVHRDLKPTNVLLVPDAEVGTRAMLLDFGIAKVPPSNATEQLTRTSAVVGTPQYMAPEQVMADDVDERTDLYALGLLLFESATGERPFTGPSDFSVMKAITESRPPLLFTLREEVPIGLALLVAQCLEKDPARRPATAGVVEKWIAEVAPLDTQPENVQQGPVERQPSRPPPQPIGPQPLGRLGHPPTPEHKAREKHWAAELVERLFNLMAAAGFIVLLTKISRCL